MLKEAALAQAEVNLHPSSLCHTQHIQKIKTNKMSNGAEWKNGHAASPTFAFVFEMHSGY